MILQMNQKEARAWNHATWSLSFLAITVWGLFDPLIMPKREHRTLFEAPNQRTNEEEGRLGSELVLDFAAVEGRRELHIKGPVGRTERSEDC